MPDDSKWFVRTRRSPQEKPITIGPFYRLDAEDIASELRAENRDWKVDLVRSRDSER